MNKIKIDPILNVKHKSYYQIDGKLGKFLNWVKKKHTLKDKIHVISHSRLMKEYLVGLDYIDELHENNFIKKNTIIKNKTNIELREIKPEKNNNTNSNLSINEYNQNIQSTSTIINTSNILNNNDENNIENINTLNKIQEYISGTNCSMIELLSNKDCKISKGYNKTDYTGPEYNNLMLGIKSPKYGYNLCK